MAHRSARPHPCGRADRRGSEPRLRPGAAVPGVSALSRTPVSLPNTQDGSSAMTYENYTKARLVEYAAREALLYGGTNCMCAVAQVLANRVMEGWGEWNAVIDNAPKYIGTIVEPVKLDPKDM